MVNIREVTPWLVTIDYLDYVPETTLVRLDTELDLRNFVSYDDLTSTVTFKGSKNRPPINLVNKIRTVKITLLTTDGQEITSYSYVLRFEDHDDDE